MSAQNPGFEERGHTEHGLNVEVLTPWIEVRFDRSEGPGGQNVNKLNTRATALLDFEACPLLSDADKSRVRQHLCRRLAADGRLRVVAQRQRSQARNRADAEGRLLELLTGALRVAKPRRPTRPTAAARRKRLRAKLQRGQLKRARRSCAPTDE